MSKFIRIYAILFLTMFGWQIYSAHRMCLNFESPKVTHEEFDLCKSFEGMGCCNKARDGELLGEYVSIVEQIQDDNRTLCSEIARDLICEECSQYSAHQFNLEKNKVASPLPGLCREYCNNIFMQCRHTISLLTNDTRILELLKQEDSGGFCDEVKLSDDIYCFPLLTSNEYLQNDLHFHKLPKQRPCQHLCIEEVANRLCNPVSIKHSGDNTHRLFVVEQRGVIWAFLPNMSRINPPFLNITESVSVSKSSYDERGLLDIQFHPDHASNGLFYIYYNIAKEDGDFVRISEMEVSSDDINRGDVKTERILLEVEKPYHNHNGGQLLFGIDGYLYIFVGDGGGVGDEFGNGQNRSTLLGKALRIDVNITEGEDSRPYGIPPDNPFVDDPTTADEIFALGLRNCWRCSMDIKGRIICGDVGQETWEEVNIIVKGGNYGWRAFEGNDCFDKEQCTSVQESHIRPIFAYNYTIGKSIIGGFVYKGCQNPGLRGKYIMGDFMSGTMILLTEKDDGTWMSENVCMPKKHCKRQSKEFKYPRYILTYGEDETGEIYFASSHYPHPRYGGGRIYKISHAFRSKHQEKCKPERINPIYLNPLSRLQDYKPLAGAGIEIELRLSSANPNRVPTQGRVEIRSNRKKWGTICGEDWDINDGHVVCRMLGFLKAREISKGKYGPGKGPVRFSRLSCKGDEDNMEECDHSGWKGTSCSHEMDAGVWCESYVFFDST